MWDGISRPGVPSPTARFAGRDRLFSVLVSHPGSVLGRLHNDTEVIRLLFAPKPVYNPHNLSCIHEGAALIWPTTAQTVLKQSIWHSLRSKSSLARVPSCGWGRRKQSSPSR